MVSKSEELLAGNDTEGILAFINTDILTEPTDLETEFAATVSKIQDINSKRSLNRHKSDEHGDLRRPTKRDCLWINLNSL